MAEDDGALQFAGKIGGFNGPYEDKQPKQRFESTWGHYYNKGVRKAVTVEWT